MIKNILIGNTNAIRAYFGNSLVWDNFDPSTLFAGGKQGVLYDPSKLSSLWQNAARTIPVTADGDSVGCIDDLSGNGNHATQTVSAARPTYRTDGVLHWLYFDGVDDRLNITNTINMDYGSFGLASKDSHISNTNAVIFSAGGAGYITIYYGKWGKNSGGTVNISSLSATASQSVTGNINGGLLTVRDSTGATGSATGAAYLSKTQLLLSFNAGSNSLIFKGSVFGIVMRTDNMTTDEQDKILDYLDRKLGDK